MENLNDVIYTLDQNFTVTYISPNVEGLSGFRFEDIIGRNFENFLPLEEKSILDRGFAKVLSGKDVVIEHRYMTRENRAAWCVNNAKPVYEEGVITGVQGTLADIAAPKNTESALSPSNHRFRGFLDHINDAVFIHDMDGRFLEMNEIACSRLGYTRSEMLQMNDSRFNCFDQSQIKLFERLAGSLAVRLAQRRAAQALQKSEEKYRLFSEVQPLSGPLGQFDQVQIVSQDITERRQAEEALAHFNDLGEQLYICPERRKQLLKFLKENGYVENFEYQAQKTDGAHIWLSMNAVAIPVEASDAFLIEGFATDITARKHAETEQERLMSAIEQTTEVIVITDMKERSISFLRV